MIGVYARVSTEEQARNGYSLQDQIRECIKKAGTEDVIKYTWNRSLEHIPKREPVTM